MQAGTFEMERIGQRIPDERGRVATLPDLPAAPPVEPEELNEEIAEEIVEEAQERESSGAQETPANGEPGGRRRRRRRRRGRDRAPLPGPGQQQPGPQMGSAENETEGAEEDEAEEGSDEPSSERADNGANLAHPGEAQAGEDGARRKRRRRRRGRRGPREGNQANGSTLLEGVPVDATVRDADAPLESIPFEDTPIAIPVANAPSEPVWSLFSEPPRERAPIADAIVTHRAAPEPPAETITPATEPVQTESAKPAPTEASDPDAPSRKGWWQRPFRIRD